MKKFIFDISNRVLVILQNHKIRSQEGISRSFLPTKGPHNFRAGTGNLESPATFFKSTGLELGCTDQ